MDGNKILLNSELGASGTLSDREFHDLFMCYHPKIKFFITKLLRNDSVAEDLTQDIFVKLWQKRDSLTDVKSINSYMYVMARNSVLNHFRNSSKYSDIADGFNQIEDSTSIEDEYYAEEKRLLISILVSTMPTKRRQVFEMSRYQQLSNDQIAEQLQISKRTVENHLSTALKEIRDAIALVAVLFGVAI